MMRWRALDMVLWLSIPVLLGAANGARPRTVCPKVVLVSEERIELTQAEQAFVCGDGKTEAWSSIPPHQAGNFLQTFLANRGYHRSTARLTDGGVTVEAGPLSVVREIVVEGDDGGLDVSRYWPLNGNPLTPKALDDLTAWLKRELATHGMPCAVATIDADPNSGKIAITFGDLLVYDMPEVQAEPIPGVNANVPRRYDAFTVGKVYDGLELELSSRRLIADDVVLSSTFITDCPREAGMPLIVRQQLVPGEPRLVTFGIGFDTEEFLIAEASWRHARFGPNASALSTMARTSFRRQRLSATFDWYYTQVVQRHFLRSLVAFDRQNERRFDSRSLTVELGPGWTWDAAYHFLELWSGVSVRHDETTRGGGPSTTESIALAADVRLVSHDFEYYAAAPRSGHQTALSWRRTSKELGSEFSATSARLSGTYLINLFDYDPALWILGARTELFTTLVGDDSTPDEVPVNYRNFLGGSATLRGFGRKQVPADDEGALTTAYLGTEFRLANVVPYGIQPIAFIDFGRVGGERGDLAEPLYWSPGVGINWQSPIGTIRSTLARGFVERPGPEDSANVGRWQFYFSFGEQF